MSKTSIMPNIYEHFPNYCAVRTVRHHLCIGRSPSGLKMLRASYSSSSKSLSFPMTTFNALRPNSTVCSSAANFAMALIKLGS